MLKVIGTVHRLREAADHVIATIFPDQFDGYDLKTLAENLRVLNDAKITGEKATTTAAKTQLAILMGWGLAGGFRALHLYNALPPSRYQLDHVFIRRRIEALMEFLRVSSEDQGEVFLKRIVRYVRAEMNKILLQRADQDERFGERKAGLETHFLKRGTHVIVHNLFLNLFGSWFYCPFCYQGWHSQSAISVHLLHCDPRPPTDAEKRKFVDDPRHYSI